MLVDTTLALDNPLCFRRIFRKNVKTKIKNEAYVINLDEYKSIKTHWVALYMNGDSVTYFDSFRVEHIPKEIKKFVRNKNIMTNSYRIQPNDSIVCGYF